jgi:hypothetical protein
MKNNDKQKNENRSKLLIFSAVNNILRLLTIPATLNGI